MFEFIEHTNPLIECIIYYLNIYRYPNKNSYMFLHMYTCSRSKNSYMFLHSHFCNFRYMQCSNQYYIRTCIPWQFLLLVPTLDCLLK